MKHYAENLIDTELNVSNSSSAGFLSDEAGFGGQSQTTKDDFVIVLEPMQIRTFIVTISRTIVC